MRPDARLRNRSGLTVCWFWNQSRYYQFWSGSYGLELTGNSSVAYSISFKPSLTWFPPNPFKIEKCEVNREIDTSEKQIDGLQQLASINKFLSTTTNFCGDINICQKRIYCTMKQEKQFKFMGNDGVKFYINNFTITRVHHSSKRNVR